MEPLLLGIDVGTSSAKAALIDPLGNPQAVAQAGYPLHHVGPAWVQQDPEDWWQAVCQAIREAIKQVPFAADRILGLAVSCQGPTLLPLDGDGRPLRPAMIWMDRRAEAEAVELAETLGADWIHSTTGNRPDAFYVAARLLWMKHHEPGLLARTRHFIQVNGYINYRLTGSYSLDPSQAALLQLREYSTGEWSKPLCEFCGVTPGQFPAICGSHQIQATVTQQAAEATGLRAGTPVMTGTVDSAAAALEAGLTEPGITVEMTGTSTVVLIPNDKGLTEQALIAMPHALPGIHLLLGAMVSSGASLRWFRDQFTSSETFDLLTQQASQSGPGSDGVIFLPYMMGERSPLWHTNARGVFFGLSLATSKSAMVRAILEGAAFSLRHNVEVAARAGAEIRELRSVGGCSRSALWNQIKADVLNRSVLLPKTSVGSPFGDAILAGRGVGLFPDLRQTLRGMVRLEQRFEPNQANHQKYTEIYGLFRLLYDHLKTDFDQSARMGQEG